MTDLRDQLQRTLGGNYTLERELGGGGMSRVYLAHETALGRQVVVKVIAPELAEGLSAERFAREVKLAARLQQANIVPVLTAGEANGLPYYTMPFVRGESLRAHLAGGHPMPMVEAVGILRDVARALAYAHAEQVVHRDIKPENILLSGGAAVVTDFGIAKAISASRTQEGAASATITQAGGSVGTPAYMAPEQAAGDAVDHRADLYAWGVVAYELLSGAHPFAGRRTAQQLIAAHLAESPDPLLSRNPAISPALASLVMRCLAKEPVQRPGSATEILAELDAAGTPTSTTPSPVAVASRKRAFIAFAVVILLGSILAVRPILRHAREVPEGTRLDKSLAVLPFKSEGGDTANAYFAEGIADELTTAFARMPGLSLAGRSSAARVAGNGSTVQEIGAALHVGAVLDGRVRRAGDRIRVSAELSSAEDGRVLWTETYERELRDVFAVQDDITRAIVAALQVRLGADQQPGAGARQGTTDLAAYDLYLQGRFFWNKRTVANLQKATALFQQAIARDSLFAEAWVGLADAYVTQPFFSLVPAAEAHRKAREAAERALAIDPELGPAHAVLAYGLMTYDWQWARADSEFRRAIALSPGDATAHKWYSDLLMMTGRNDTALVEVNQALALDPLSPNVLAILGEIEWFAGHEDQALAAWQKALDLDPDHPLALELASRLYWQRGDMAHFFSMRERYQAASPRVAPSTEALRRAYASGGRAAILRAQLAAPVARSLPSERARWHADLGDLDAAFRDLDDAVSQRDMRLVYTTYFADCAQLWKDPRWATLLTRMGVRDFVRR